MTTSNETKKMPDRIAFTSTHGFVDAESQQRPEDQDAFRAELARRWNAYSVLSQLADYAQHAPVCRGPGIACDCGLKELLEELGKSTL